MHSNTIMQIRRLHTETNAVEYDKSVGLWQVTLKK